MGGAAPAQGLPATSVNPDAVETGDILDIADQTFLANHSGSAASPTAETDGVISKKIDARYFLRQNSFLRECWVNEARSCASALTALASGSAYLSAIVLFKGDVVTNLTFGSGTTAWTGATTPHRYFVLYNSAGEVLAYSADDGANAWAANASKTLALATVVGGGGPTYTVPTTGLYYIGVAHSFGSGAANTFAGAAGDAINAALVVTPFRGSTCTSALDGSSIPQNVTPVFVANQPTLWGGVT